MRTPGGKVGRFARFVTGRRSKYLVVLLDTLLVRSVIVPAVVWDVGPKVWWPGGPRR